MARGEKDGSKGMEIFKALVTYYQTTYQKLAAFILPLALFPQTFIV